MTKEGLQEIVNLKSTMNLGINDKLKILFPNSIKKIRPEVKDINIINPHYVDLLKVKDVSL